MVSSMWTNSEQLFQWLHWFIFCHASICEKTMLSFDETDFNSVYIGEQFAKGMFTQYGLFC